MFSYRKRSSMVEPGEALSGRPTRPFEVNPSNVVLKSPLEGPWPAGSEVLYLAMGCFWGAERIFWRLPGVVNTAVGYMGGYTPHPTYEETCTGLTGHAETVQVVYDPALIDPEHLLKAFWENHDPTQGNRQGNDVGTAYRSAIYWTTEGQRLAIEATRDAIQGQLTTHGFGQITTEITTAAEAGQFYLAEDYHQQYLFKNPGGYCNHGPNGLTCPTGLVRQDQLPAQQDVLAPTTTLPTP